MTILQAMFMRLRAHTCQYCNSIDLAHYKRHKELAELLYAIYEYCGEPEWSIHTSNDNEPESVTRTWIESLETSESPDNSRSITKRDKKDAKHLARAAGRVRVVTQEDLNYLDSVIHVDECMLGSDNNGPANADECEEIANNLRYHANVYNSKVGRRDRESLASRPEVYIDFDAEIERILNIFHVPTLFRRSIGSGGVQGKEFKVLQSMIEGFKLALVDDLVLVKTDVIEVRMRRAGYLRYTNKSSYEIIEARYAVKDWKTGGKFTQRQPSPESELSSSDGFEVAELADEYVCSFSYFGLAIPL